MGTLLKSARSFQILFLSSSLQSKAPIPRTWPTRSRSSSEPLRENVRCGPCADPTTARSPSTSTQRRSRLEYYEAWVCPRWPRGLTRRLAIKLSGSTCGGTCLGRQGHNVEPEFFHGAD